MKIFEVLQNLREQLYSKRDMGGSRAIYDVSYEALIGKVGLVSR